MDRVSPPRKRYRPRSNASNRSREVCERFPGVLQTRQTDVFASDSCRTALRELGRAVSSSVDAIDRDTTAAERRQGTDTDVGWTTSVRGSAPMHEVTLPGVHCGHKECAILKRRADGAVVHRVRRPPRVGGHTVRIQRAADVLAAAALGEIGAACDGGAGDLYHMGTQVTSAPLGSGRTAHVDPCQMAAALATFSLQGTAAITISARGRSSHELECSSEYVYMLTGPALVEPVRHAVEVTAARRVSVTLRFASKSYLEHDYLHASRS